MIIFAASSTIVSISARSLPDQFYNDFQRQLESEGIDQTMSQCVVDDLRKYRAADAIPDDVTIEGAKRILAPYMDHAALICVRSAVSYHVSTQRIINLSLWGLCIFLAIASSILRLRRRNAARQSSDDEPLLR